MPDVRHKSSSWSGIALKASAGPVGLVLGYVILCQFGPQFDFLGIWHANVPSRAASNANRDAGGAERKPALKSAEETTPTFTAGPAAAPSPAAAALSTADESETEQPSPEAAKRSAVIAAAALSRVSVDDKPPKIDDKLSKGAASQPPDDDQSMLRCTSVGELQQAFGKARTAKQVVQFLSGTIADANVPDDARNYAKSQLPQWEQRAAQNYVRFGEGWMPLADAAARRDKANELLSQAAGLLNLENQQPALERLTKAARLDPDATTAVFVLGVHDALGLRNYQEAKDCFTDCLHRRPDDAGALNDVGLACLMLGRHAEALKNFRAAATIAPRSIEIAHNLRRMLKQDGLKSIALPPSVKNGYVDLLNGMSGGDSAKELDAFGWLYLLPAAAPAVGGLAPELADVLPRFGQGNIDKTVRIHARWIEDCQCLWCQGAGKVPCTNPECASGKVVVVVGTEVVGKDPLTKKSIYRDKMGTRDCPTCKGVGHLNCEKCFGLRTEPMLSGIRTEVSKQ